MKAKNSIIPVFVPHLGCPHDCVFCNQRHISGSSSQATGETVSNALEKGLKICGASSVQLAFYGGSFTSIPVWRQTELLEAARPYLDGGQISSIRVSTRPDCVDESSLRRLADYGVTTIELGAQSMRDEVLKLAGRGHLAGDTVTASRLVKDTGFELVIQMMTGLPGDDDSGALLSAKLVAALRPDAVRIYPAVIIKDTRLYELWKNGEYREHSVEDAVRVCSRILPVFDKSGIDVIRIGLNPTRELSAGKAVAGAYHPSLGELVRSRVMLERARDKMRDVPVGSAAALYVPAGKISLMTGRQRANIFALIDEYKLKSLKVKENPDLNDIEAHILIEK